MPRRMRRRMHRRMLRHMRPRPVRRLAGTCRRTRRRTSLLHCGARRSDLNALRCETGFVYRYQLDHIIIPPATRAPRPVGAPARAGVPRAGVPACPLLRFARALADGGPLRRCAGIDEEPAASLCTAS